MTLQKTNPTQTEAWKQLQVHFDEEMKFIKMQDLFASNSKRVESFSIDWNNFIVDYSKNRITDKTISLLLQLANEVGLQQAIQSYFEGKRINETEKRAVLHTALRAKKESEILVEGENIITEISEVKERIALFSEQIISGNRTGYTNLPFTDVVNIGIGGSDLGPAMVVEALQLYKNHLNIHFVSNIDGDPIQELLNKLNPETTLFIIVSKSFTTQETLMNATTIKKWFLTSAEESDIAKHFIAVSTNISKVVEFGITPENTFPMWDWVGGRFSLWSAVGLSIALSIGYDKFEELLAGANAMDQHFKTEDFKTNIPVILALLSIWYNNFYNAETEAIIPYAQHLQKLVPYLQQAIMESNGKNVSRSGDLINYQTGTIIWGEPGSNAQHAFFQLLHQGTKLIPTDFIGFKESLHQNKEHHNHLMANFFAQTEALLKGKTKEEVRNEFSSSNWTEDEIETILPFKIFEGNKPTNTILIQKLTPFNLGALLAMYEHKIFVQGIIWNVFSYDQWGVELGKQLATSILNEFDGQIVGKHDASTSYLIQKFLS